MENFGDDGNLYSYFPTGFVLRNALMHSHPNANSHLAADAAAIHAYNCKMMQSAMENRNRIGDYFPDTDSEVRLIVPDSRSFLHVKPIGPFQDEEEEEEEEEDEEEEEEQMVVVANNRPKSGKKKKKRPVAVPPPERKRTGTVPPASVRMLVRGQRNERRERSPIKGKTRVKTVKIDKTTATPRNGPTQRPKAFGAARTLARIKHQFLMKRSIAGRSHRQPAKTWQNPNNRNQNDYESNNRTPNETVAPTSPGVSKSQKSDRTVRDENYNAFGYQIKPVVTRRVLTETFIPTILPDDQIRQQCSLLTPSLFPQMPPYLTFSLSTERPPVVPPELQRILKWRYSRIIPKIVRQILDTSGIRWCKKGHDWVGVWGRHMKSPCFKRLREYQKINHIPGTFIIGRKDSCWKHLSRQMNKHGRFEFGFMPQTFIIPQDLQLLRKLWSRFNERRTKWIIKPPARARGMGVHVVSKWEQIPKRRPLIVQKYIDRPFLLNGSKFDMRLYVLVTSLNPMRVYMYKDGLARFASVKYSDKSETLNDRCMHLTNYSINKFSMNYTKNDDVNACHGHKWSLKSLWSYLAVRGIRTDMLWEALKNLVLRTILAGETPINNVVQSNVESQYSCYELFGFDVILDSDLVPWLLEVNVSPSLHSELPIDASVKGPLVCGVLNAALLNVPPRLSPETQKRIANEMSLPSGNICFDQRIYTTELTHAEQAKHKKYTSKPMDTRDSYLDSILDYLTPDDVRCLIIAEDELNRCYPLERIFPTQNSHQLLKFSDTTRYYNRLLDAWENRYADRRKDGIEVLQHYCNVGYHLCVDGNRSSTED